MGTNKNAKNIDDFLNGSPLSKKELYETGCKCLCEEHNPSWSDIRNMRTVDELTVAQKFGIKTTFETGVNIIVQPKRTHKLMPLHTLLEKVCN